MPSKALILVDFENEWIDENSDYYIGDVSKLIENTNRLIDFCRRQAYKIIFIAHVEADSDGAFAPGSKNVAIIEGLDKLEGDVVIEKNKISPFYNTSLEDELAGIDSIVVAGILTNLCVRSTVQDAYDRDFDITVVTDCCQALDRQIHDFTLRDLKETREEVQLVRVEEFVQ